MGMLDTGINYDGFWDGWGKIRVQKRTLKQYYTFGSMVKNLAPSQYGSGAGVMSSIPDTNMRIFRIFLVLSGHENDVKLKNCVQFGVVVRT